jgi:predicted ATPase
MEEFAREESARLFLHAGNFAHWYRFLSLENQGAVFNLRRDLMDVLPGFDGLRLKDAGDSKRLVADFRMGDKDYTVGFAELSDGQRQLIVLYAILEALRAGEFSALFIDEPDNFVSLREIQPWQQLLEEVCDEGKRQAVIVSHHPEIINAMAHGSERWFSRPQGLHVRAAPFPAMDGLTPAEIVARGWDDE